MHEYAAQSTVNSHIIVGTRHGGKCARGGARFEKDVQHADDVDTISKENNAASLYTTNLLM
jgi:hypothetical protein